MAAAVVNGYNNERKIFDIGVFGGNAGPLFQFVGAERSAIAH
jgi:hypothetical protein